MLKIFFHMSIAMLLFNWKQNKFYQSMPLSMPWIELSKTQQTDDYVCWSHNPTLEVEQAKRKQCCKLCTRTLCWLNAILQRAERWCDAVVSGDIAQCIVTMSFIFTSSLQWKNKRKKKKKFFSSSAGYGICLGYQDTFCYQSRTDLDTFTDIGTVCIYF